MIAAVVLFCGALSLSAFFSGNETGLYRVSRTRMVLDGLSGSWSARGIVWLLNYPSIYVATILVGNNLANYLVSLSLVLGIGAMFPQGETAQFIGPILLTPVVFIFGELLPKHLYFHAPYRLLRKTRSFLLMATIVFSPISMVLGLLDNLMRMITGHTPFRLRLTMAREELDQLMRAGHEAGILVEGQRKLAQNLFEVGNQPAISVGVLPERLAIVDAPLDVTAARHQARRRNHPIILVRKAGRIVGFVKYADLCLRTPCVTPRPVIRGRVSDRHLRVLLRLYDRDSDVAVLYDENGDMRCVVTRRQLIQSLLK
jgi:CBS domain containing-hemolysin-like protein